MRHGGTAVLHGKMARTDHNEHGDAALGSRRRVGIDSGLDRLAFHRNIRTVDGGLAVRLRGAGRLPLTALVFVACCLWSATQLLRIRSDGVRFAVPFLICVLTLAILLYAPLRQVYLQQNFDWYRADRERIVARVERGELKPNVGYNRDMIALGDSAPHVSAGNDIVVDQAEEGTYVLF